jgi:hypothetical protein
LYVFAFPLFFFLSFFFFWPKFRVLHGMSGLE